MIFLEVDDLMHIARRVVSPDVGVRDIGLLAAAVSRPRTSAFGDDAYPSIHEKAAALLHSIVRNHALVDGNKRLGLAAVIGFLGMNGWRLTMTEAEAYELVIDVATGRCDEVSAIAQRLAVGSHLPARR